MKPHDHDQGGDWFKGAFQHGCLPLLIAIVATIAVLGMWQAVLQAVTPGRAALLPQAVLVGGLAGAWVLALLVYLTQRSERYLQQARQLNQQLQAEIDGSERAQLEADRRLAEAALRESEEKFRQLTENIRAVFWMSDPSKGQVLYVSPTYEEIWGRSCDDLYRDRSNWSDAIHPDDRDRVFQAHHVLQAQAHNGFADTYDAEYRIIRPDGSIRWIHDRGFPVKNDTADVSRIAGIAEDITERKQTEAVLAKELLRSQALFNTSIDGIVIMNDQGDVVQTSPGFARMLGYSIEETLTLNVADWDAQWTRAELQQILAGEKRLGPLFETRHRRKDGSLYEVEISYSRVEIDRETMHLCICRDISERKHVEIALQNSQARFAGILEIASDAIISVDIHQRITLFNQGAERIFGYTSNEVLGQPLARLLPDRYTSIHHHHVNQYAQTGADARQMSVRGAIFGRRKDGTEFPAEASISKLNLNGEVIFTTFLRDISDRQRLEAERQQSENDLRESEARFQAFMDHSPASAWITDANGIMLYVSQTYRHTFQLPTTDLIGRSIFELYPTAVAQQFLANIQTVAETQSILKTVETAPRFDGTMGDFWVYKFPIPDRSGQVLVGGVAIDVTKQTRAEAALRQSEATRQAIIQAIPDLLIRMRADGNYVECISNSQFNLVNPERYRHNANVCNILPSALAQRRLHYVQQALQSHTIQLYEHDILIAGKQCYEEVRVVPLLEDEVLVMVRDITHRKQVEIELNNQKEILQTMFDHMPIMIALLDQNQQVETINPELQQTLGWSLQEWQQSDALMKCYPDANACEAAMKQMLVANGTWQDYISCTASGQQLHTTWANVHLSNGYQLAIGQNITERKQYELRLKQTMEAAEAANLAKSAFLANMSHELRTPLNVILGFAQVMAHDPALTPTQQDDLRTIQRSGDHLLSLINDVLDLSKIEAGHFDLDITGFDLIALLHTLRTMMTKRAASKQLQLEFEIAPDIPQFVIADEQKLRQVLLNLLSNAIKFTQVGKVALRAAVVAAQGATATRKEDNLEPHHPAPTITLQFEVSDTGAGIAEAEQATIFDAFVQATAGKKTMGGTGLGLTICRKLLELMHGTITVQSAPDVGSTFTVTVPVCPTSSIQSQPEYLDRVVVGLAPGQPRHRILVVDDQRENRLLLVRLLAPLELELREATNGRDAVQIWQEWRPDLIWMDIRMPEMDGYEATRWIRSAANGRTREKEDGQDKGEADQQSSFSPPIIIALTAHASQSDRDLALAAGCNDYVSKPFRESTLFLKLKEYLGLEYLYAETVPSSENQPMPPPSTQTDDTGLLTPDLLALLQPGWCQSLEDAAIRGDDQAIRALTMQLPATLTALQSELMRLADHYQFEEIQQLVHNNHPATLDD